MDDPHVTRHLLRVATTLRRETGPDLPPALARRRRRLLVALERYARRGRFPRPDGPVVTAHRRVSPPRAFAGPGQRAPIFEDREGRRCAVGHLVGLARPDLVAAIRDRDNGVFLPELDAPELDRWAMHHGLTRDELAWIQPSYCWEIPECTVDFEVSAPAPVAQVCAGPNPTLLGPLWAPSMSCQQCGGPLRAWVWVQNAGSETTTDVNVSLGADEELLDSVILPELAPGEVVQVGPLLAPDIAAVNHSGWVRIEAADDCAPNVDQEPWGYPSSYQPPGFVAPEACGGGCPGYTWVDSADTGTTPVPVDSGEDTAGQDTAGGSAAEDISSPAVPKGGCGCGTGGAGAGVVGWVVLLVGHRRRGRASRAQGRSRS